MLLLFLRREDGPGGVTTVVVIETFQFRKTHSSKMNRVSKLVFMKVDFYMRMVVTKLNDSFDLQARSN